MGFNKEKIEELYPEAKMYEAQLINKGNETLLKTACESGNYFGQLKKDGYWYQFEKHEHNSYLFSRSASTVTKLQAEKSANVPHIVDALNILPDETILIGEIYYPGGTSKNVTTIMGCLAPKAIERQNGSYGKIHYYIHDILMYKGVDFVEQKATNWQRYQILQKIFYLHKLNKYDFLELAESWEDDLYSRVGDSLAAGEEGMVIKAKDGIYEPGKRPITNLKAKQVDFADAIIIGFESPTIFYYGQEIENWQYWIALNEDDIEYKLPIGCYYNQEGSATDGYFKAVTKPYYMGWSNARIKIGAYDENGNIKEIGIIHSGITDEMKKDMTENPQKYLNKVVKIQCMSLDKKERTIRHGFYKGIHPEKNPQECTLQEIFS